MRRPLLVLALMAGLATPAPAQSLEFSSDEVAQILSHGPWPVPFKADPSNRASGTTAGIALGRALFFDARVSPDLKFACVSCHIPAHGWSEAKAVSEGREPLIRNAISLLDVRLRRWFGWDGGQDSLWAMSLRPMLDDKEIGATPADLAALLREDDLLATSYQAAFGQHPDTIAPDQLSVDLAKALAAFQETLDSPRSAFDDFRDRLAKGQSPGNYPLEAQRGLKLFIGRGNCMLCHLGPAFSNGEFHDVGVPFFTPDGVDPGRHQGIKTLQASSVTLLGSWNDDPNAAPGSQTRHLDPQHRNFGEFRTPSLRNVALSAPYMHSGSKKDLRAVIRHYSEIDPDRLHADGEAILKPLNLSETDIDDLIAFLQSLTSLTPLPTGTTNPTPQ